MKIPENWIIMLVKRKKEKKVKYPFKVNQTFRD
jgi:hypothetical protein